GGRTAGEGRVLGLGVVPDGARVAGRAGGAAERVVLRAARGRRAAAAATATAPVDAAEVVVDAVRVGRRDAAIEGRVVRRRIVAGDALVAVRRWIRTHRRQGVVRH